MRTIPLALLFPLVVGLGACRAEEALQQDFDAYVAARQSCLAAPDCTLVYPGCPLGCAVAVANEHAADVEARAEALIAEYEAPGRSCAYDCLSVVAACTGGRCAVIEGEGRP